MISVWYDTSINGIWVSFRDDPFLARSLTASANGDVVTIRITGSTGDPVSVAPFGGFGRQDGSSFASAGEAVAYLQGEFAKTVALGTSLTFAPAAQIAISHGLGFFPNVSVIDSSGDPVVGFIVQHLSTAALTITFGGATSGTAYVS